MEKSLELTNFHIWNTYIFLRKQNHLSQWKQYIYEISMCVEQDFSKKQLIVSVWNEHVSLLSFYILLKHNAFSEQPDIEK